MNLRIRKSAAVAAAMGAAVAAPSVAFGALTSTLNGIRLNTAGLPAPISTRAAVDDFANWPVTYQAGETVTATAPDGTVTTLASNAATAGSAAFVPAAGGLWKLANSSGETVLLGVAWSVFNDGTSQNSAPYTPLALDTVGEGPNRKAKARQHPPVAYTGDNWTGSASAVSTLTFTPPADSADIATTLDLTGTGATPFRFRGAGEWTVLLAMADGTTLQAAINIDGGTVFYVR